MTASRVRAVAAKLFREKGFDATSTREIAEALGIQKASLYYHIRDKEELLYDICTASLDHTFASASAAEAEFEDPEKRLVAFIRGHMLALTTDRDLNTTMLTNFRSLTGPRRKDIQARRDRYDDIAERLIADAQASGALTPDTPSRHLSLALMNLLNWTMFWYRPNGELAPQAIADLIVRMFFSGAGNHTGNSQG